MTPARELDWYSPPNPRYRTALCFSILAILCWWTPVLGAATEPIIDVDNTESVRLILNFFKPFAVVIVGCVVVLSVGKAIQWARSSR